MGHRLFFRRISQNLDDIQTFCNDRRNLFHFHVINGIHKIIHNVHRYTYMNSYTNTSINICILV